jgi:hypothetical protein
VYAKIGMNDVRTIITIREYSRAFLLSFETVDIRSARAKNVKMRRNETIRLPQGLFR